MSHAHLQTNQGVTAAKGLAAHIGTEAPAPAQSSENIIIHNSTHTGRGGSTACSPPLAGLRSERRCQRSGFAWRRASARATALARQRRRGLRRWSGRRHRAGRRYFRYRSPGRGESCTGGSSRSWQQALSDEDGGEEVVRLCGSWRVTRHSLQLEANRRIRRIRVIGDEPVQRKDGGAERGPPLGRRHGGREVEDNWRAVRVTHLREEGA